VKKRSPFSEKRSPFSEKCSAFSFNHSYLMSVNSYLASMYAEWKLSGTFVERARRAPAPANICYTMPCASFVERESIFLKYVF
jgi:hypothetical protein